ncbi:RNA recognition motif-containing protein [Toxoplasma gondii TgCatPRC2]|uniref:RNA recognition motif-containing protein n=14 Tax=Toxoplasma gondii TaxID=5811 RepID=B9PM06_TOXGV|nr:RNA recognition motif-containing protein [Toxoplasma gondii ME49]EPR61996.1 RNA recognition motif-containing protein [Toxoplasma gondii GT1]ESS32358.1 RNA recognition motif-containing protein [Toxoplasma gondii VEG]KFG31348.1 RNA recognition motif-containing protein [Toxoplasma gondii p89]KFG45762.1 RNA recognition motif-containing protein [Toxoplasma gondii GAB2-2007-GAL-DOM2]KFG53802.1 RNA recognition motif-containing protein [Toxoplasma gondii FOU]KFG58176.1 RNA recognition motif-contai|eukprot:XP_002366079.1 RNA recognition motif-containing protein [Toxoplasma gondii ME49]
MAAPPQYGIHPYSHYGYAYGAGTTAAVAAADYTWGANAAQYSQWQTPSAQSAPNPLDQEPDALQSRTLFFGRLPEDVTEDSLRDVVLQHGDLKKVAVYPEKRMAFVEFYDLRHAEAARDALRGSDVLGKRVEVQFSAVKRPDKDGNTGTLYVRPVSTVHVSGNWTDPNSLDAYRELFSKHGDLKKVSANRKRETEKFVEYFDLRDAQKALESLNGYVFNGATLHICFAQNASRTINKNVERSGASRRTPESYGPVRGSSSGSGGMSRAYASAPYAAPYAAGPAAYGAYAVPYQPAPYSLYAYQQPQPQAANGYPATQQWASATAPVAAPTAAAVPYAVAPQAASTSATSRSSPGSGAAVSTSYAGTAPAPAAGTTSVAAPRW